MKKSHFISYFNLGSTKSTKNNHFHFSTNITNPFSKIKQVEIASLHYCFAASVIYMIRTQELQKKYK